jgi:hemolysin activation/secretion protein
MSTYRRFPSAVLACLIAVAALGSRGLASDDTKKGESQGFLLRWVLIADTAAKTGGLKPPSDSNNIVIEDVPLLNTKDFANLIHPYIGRPISAALVEQLVKGITNFVKEHGQQLVYVTVPEQNIAQGALRVVVVLGRYNLSRLLISDSQEKAAALNAGPGAGQIVIQDLPSFATQEFGAAVAPLFGQPITDESLKALVGACTAYAHRHQAVVAAVQIPNQSITGGELRLAVVLGHYPLRRIIISDTAAGAASARPPAGAGSVVADHSPLFATPEFARYAAPFIDQPITPALVERLEAAVIAYAKSHDRLLVDVPLPAEDLARGEIKLAVIIGHYNQLVFKGNRWFSNRLLASTLGVKPGDEVRVSELEAGIDWANQNPFRQMSVLINTVDKGPDIADLDIAVQEHVPIRLAATYDDTGIAILGDNHYSGSIQFGNLWGLDQQATYQFTTTDDSRLYQAQTLDYRVPLPWRNYLEFDAAYCVVRPTNLFGYEGFDESGSNEVADLKYVAPMKLGRWSLSPAAGLDYKQVNTNLEFGQSVPIPVATYDIAQLTGGLTAIRADALGSWTFVANLNFSPGNFNTRNTDAFFNTAGSGRSARYVYGLFVAQRATALPGDFQWISRGELQLSSTNLQGSEELTVGGMATVRGYNQGVFSGDQGWVVNEELRGPSWRWHVPLLPKRDRPMETRPLVFWDYSRVSVKHDYAAMAPLNPIMSAGVGIRSNLASNLSLSADFGWQLLETTEPQPNHDRGDIQVSFAY